MVFKLLTPHTQILTIGRQEYAGCMPWYFAKSGPAGTQKGAGRHFVDLQPEKHVAGQMEKEDPGRAASKRLTHLLVRAKLSCLSNSALELLGPRLRP